MPSLQSLWEETRNTIQRGKRSVVVDHLSMAGTTKCRQIRCHSEPALQTGIQRKQLKQEMESKDIKIFQKAMKEQMKK